MAFKFGSVSFLVFCILFARRISSSECLHPSDGDHFWEENSTVSLQSNKKEESYPSKFQRVGIEENESSQSQDQTGDNAQFRGPKDGALRSKTVQERDDESNGGVILKAGSNIFKFEEVSEFFKIQSFAIVPSSIALDPPDGGTITIWMDIETSEGLSSDSAEIYPPQIIISTPTGKTLSGFITSDLRTSGNQLKGHYKIPIHVTPWNVGNGRCDVALVYLADTKGNAAYFTNDNLLAQGYDPWVQVSGSLTDFDAPMLLRVHVQQLSDCLVTHQKRRDEEIQGSPCPVEVALEIEESRSGIAPTSNIPQLLSRITIRSTSSPAPQRVTEYITLRDSVKSSSTIRTFSSTTEKQLRQQQPIKTKEAPSSFKIAIEMPFWAWPGGWEIIEIFLADAAGNTNRWDRSALVDMQFATTFFVNNVNLTYLGEDLFDYVEADAVQFDEYDEDED